MMLVFEERSGKKGTRESKRIRREGGLPAVFYGKGLTTTPVSIDHGEFQKIYRAGEHAVTGRFVDREDLYLIHDVQLDALGDVVLHVDFRRIERDEKVQVKVAIETIGTPKAGILDHMMVDIEVECVPLRIPDHIDVRIAEMVIGDIVRVSDLSYPDGVEPAVEGGLPVLALHAPKGMDDEPEEGVEGEAAEPERIGEENDAEDDS